MAAKNNDQAKPNDQKILTSGRGFALSVGKVVPHSWSWVRVTVVAEDKNSVTLHIRKLVIREAK